MNRKKYDVIIVGAGFTGLSACLELARAGKKTLLLESYSSPGGLAGTFEFKDGVVIEKFYHHWFNNDLYVPELVKSLGLESEMITLPSNTSMYYNGRIWKLSTPFDLLRFTALSLLDRIKLGLMVFHVRRVKNWKLIESLTIREWLEPLCGPAAYEVVWEPLINSKFSNYAEKVNAVWMWKKLILRGGTRDKKGREELVYFKGGFGRLAQSMCDEIARLGGEVRLNSKVEGLKDNGGLIVSAIVNQEDIEAKQFIFTPAFPIIADIFKKSASQEWLDSLMRVNYLGNICLVLQLKQSLSNTYWLNVNDPSFPFVGVIEHTNFDKSENYNGTHLVYLSRYLVKEDPLWGYSDSEYYEFAFVHLQRMFPEIKKDWIIEFKIWRASYAQPVMEKNYSQYVPGVETPFKNGWITTMAHIYPEDRGTNYAIREGINIARKIVGNGLDDEN